MCSQDQELLASIIAGPEDMIPDADLQQRTEISIANIGGRTCLSKNFLLLGSFISHFREGIELNRVTKK